ncbi:caspase family protein, partial [Roseomonas sp. PWR1]
AAAPPAAAPTAAALAAVAAAPPVAAAPRPPAQAIDGRRVALVIGNGDYTHGTPLRNPANDARRMAEVLEGAGFEVVLGLDLDRRGMETKIREFGNRLEGGRIGLFFYAGHAMQVAGENYLLPIDAMLERERDLAFETVSLGQVLRAMESSAATNLVFLDACRDNPLTRSFQRSLGTRSAAVGQGLAQVQSGLGTLVAYATQPGNVALDGRDANSPFTSALAQHLATPGVDIAIAMRRVRESVVAATGGRQVPWDHSSLTGDVVLVGAPAAAPAPVASAAPAAEPAGGVVRGGADREVVFWQSALAGGRPADFEAYLQAYPDGTFAPLARSRLGR